MYCPRCSQEQASEELKFCSRCGFPLAVVSEIVMHGGFLPQLAALNKEKTVFTRRNGLIFSLFWFMFFVLLLTPIFGGVFDIDRLASIFAILGTVGCLIFLVASLVLLKKEPKESRLLSANAEQEFTKNLYAKNQTALPPQQSIPISSYSPVQGNWRDTKDLVQPSVTENTTTLLERKEKP